VEIQAVTSKTSYTVRFLLIASFVFAAMFGAMAPSVASASVDLFFAPSLVFSPGPSCTPGMILTVQLRARSSTASPEALSSISVILQWDPTKLQFMENIPNTMPEYEWGFEFYPNDGVVNPDYSDGDAFYDAFAQIVDPPSAPANNTNGMLVTTFKFKVLAPTGGSILQMIGSRGSVLTQVVGLEADDITGNISNTSLFKVANACDCLLGDVNIDGQYTFADIAAAVDVLLGIDTTPSHINAVDANCDNVANGLDIQGFTNFMLLAL
jgi:hypothetical protein